MAKKPWLECVCRAVRASRCGSVPSYLVLPGDAEPADQVAEMAALANRCAETAIATTHKLCRALLLVEWEMAIC